MPAMQPDFGIVYQPWNARRGADDLLERVADEAGVQRITVLAVCPAVEQIRFLDNNHADTAAPDAAEPGRYYRSNGGWHYQPDTACYADTRIKPRAARGVRGADTLDKLVERAAARDLRLTFRVDLRGVADVLDRYPQVRCKNAWGDETLTAGACVSNPDVRELLRDTLAELAQYDPAGFEIADWTIDTPTNRLEPRPFDWHPAARRLLDVCFCESCRQAALAAGVDPDSAARSVRVHFDNVATAAPIAAPTPAMTAPPIAAESHRLPRSPDDDRVLISYRTARASHLNDWLARLAGEHDQRVRMHLLDSTASRVSDDAADAWRPLVRLADIGAAGAHEVSAGLSLAVWRPTFNDSAAFVRLVTKTTEAGVRYFDFEGLHEAPPEALTWLKQALRFARRR